MTSWLLWEKLREMFLLTYFTNLNRLTEQSLTELREIKKEYKLVYGFALTRSCPLTRTTTVASHGSNQRYKSPTSKICRTVWRNLYQWYLESWYNSYDVTSRFRRVWASSPIMLLVKYILVLTILYNITNYMIILCIIVLLSDSDPMFGDSELPLINMRFRIS